MALHLITGYAGREHITSADQGAYNMGTIGEGQFIFARENKFEATVVSNNSIQIKDGEAMMQGRFIKLPTGTTEELTIENGASGMKRNDLIVIRYRRDPSSGFESAELAVIKGTPVAGTPSDPEYTVGDITDGNDLVNDMPLYRVSIIDYAIQSITLIAETMTSVRENIEHFTITPAKSNVLGGVMVDYSSGLRVDNLGKLTLKAASNGELGGVKIKTLNVKLINDITISPKSYAYIGLKQSTNFETKYPELLTGYVNIISVHNIGNSYLITTPSSSNSIAMYNITDASITFKNTWDIGIVALYNN